VAADAVINRPTRTGRHSGHQGAIEDSEVVSVLRSRVISSVELALQPDRDAGNVSAGEGSEDQVGRRVGEGVPVKAFLDTVPSLSELDRVKVHPTAGTAGHL